MKVLLTHIITGTIIRVFVALFGLKWLLNALFSQIPSELLIQELNIWMEDIPE